MRSYLQRVLAGAVGVDKGGTVGPAVGEAWRFPIRACPWQSPSSGMENMHVSKSAHFHIAVHLVRVNCAGHVHHATTEYLLPPWKL